MWQRKGQNTSTVVAKVVACSSKERWWYPAQKYAAVLLQVNLVNLESLYFFQFPISFKSLTLFLAHVQIPKVASIEKLILKLNF